MVAHITPAQLAARLAQPNPPVVLDVREPWEVSTCAIAGALHIPMGDIATQVNTLDPEQALVCVCHHGSRSLQVGLFLANQGFTQVYNLSGGIDAWARDVQPSMPRY